MFYHVLLKLNDSLSPYIQRESYFTFYTQCTQITPRCCSSRYSDRYADYNNSSYFNHTEHFLSVSSLFHTNTNTHII